MLRGDGPGLIFFEQRDCNIWLKHSSSMDQLSAPHPTKVSRDVEENHVFFFSWVAFANAFGPTYVPCLVMAFDLPHFHFFSYCRKSQRQRRLIESLVSNFGRRDRHQYSVWVGGIENFTWDSYAQSWKGFGSTCLSLLRGEVVQYSEQNNNQPGRRGEGG